VLVKFGGIEKHSVYLFVCFLFFCFYLFVLENFEK